MVFFKKKKKKRFSMNFEAAAIRLPTPVYPWNQTYVSACSKRAKNQVSCNQKSLFSFFLFSLSLSGELLPLLPSSFPFRG
jgi:hypothetical protein